MSKQERWRQLTDAMIRETATDSDAAELSELLRDDPLAQAEYLSYLNTHAALCWEFRDAAAAGGSPVVPRSSAPKPHVAAGMRTWLPWAAAVVLLLGVIGLLVLRDVPLANLRDVPSAEMVDAEPMDHGVAVVARAVEAEWKGASLLPDDSMKPGRWELLNGVVELEFYSGASVILEAPTAIEVLSENAATLHYGKLRAHVPLQAQGFTIRTREIELVDMGTEFAMEVTDETGTAVHVLDGKVGLFAPDGIADKGKELVAGQGQLVDPNGKHSEMMADPSHFVSREELAQQVEELQKRTHQRWQTASVRLREDPRLLAYYDFQPLPEQERVLPNLSLNPYPGLDGAIVGARWKWGRWREHKRALDFKSAADRVRIEVPGRVTSVTLVAWVRLDRLDRPYNVLLASQDWNRPGAVHWRIQNRGVLQLQVNNGLSQKECTSSAPLVVQPSDFHRWMSLVAVYDGERGTASQYRNGALLGVSELKAVDSLAIGKAEIANWTGSGKGSRQIRYFNGRFGELLIFKEALSAKEIEELHQNGNKYN